MQNKILKLKQILTKMNSILVAFSGGIDSTLLAKLAVDTLGYENVLAVTACSETYPAEEWQQAKELASSLNIEITCITTEELKDENFVNNPPERCYHCKKSLFAKLQHLAKENHLDIIIDGSNADDLKDFRPGMKAGQELGIRSPLQEAGLTKKEIRSFAHSLGLPNWDKPSSPCLSSRFPYGHKITLEKLKQVDEGERFLRGLEFTELRVRHHGEIARIEVPEKDIERLSAPALREQIVTAFRSLGFTYITVDLNGFCSGNLNQSLPKETYNG